MRGQDLFPLCSVCGDVVGEEPKSRELTDCPEVQFSDSVEALSAKIESIEEKITLCDVIFQDLVAVQRVVKEKGLCEAGFQEQKKQADFTL